MVGTQSTGNYLYIYYNTGTPEEPQFGPHNFLLNKGMFVSITNAAPELFDLDGDGVKDMISGNSMGDILYYHNSGTNSAMVFDDPASLEAGGEVMKVDKYSQFCFCDWNNDGVTDMVVGDKNEKVMLYLGKGGTATLPVEELSHHWSLRLKGDRLEICNYPATVTQLDLFSSRGQLMQKLSVRDNTSEVLPKGLASGFYIAAFSGKAGVMRKRFYLP